jgi:excisionase family DNA binding protein
VFLAVVATMNNVTGGRDVLTTGEVAELLGSSRQHVVDMCVRGEVSFVWVGKHRRIPRSEVDRILHPRLTRDQERSLWLHRAVAGRLVTDPRSAMDKALDNIERLAKTHRGTRAGGYVERWRSLLHEGVDSVLDVLTSAAPEAIELRQNSPFAGVLSEDDRQACLSAFREHWHGEHAA